MCDLFSKDSCFGSLIANVATLRDDGAFKTWSPVRVHGEHWSQKGLSSSHGTSVLMRVRSPKESKTGPSSLFLWFPVSQCNISSHIHSHHNVTNHEIMQPGGPHQSQYHDVWTFSLQNSKLKKPLFVTHPWVFHYSNRKGTITDPLPCSTFSFFLFSYTHVTYL